MSELLFVGAGLGDERDLGERSLHELRRSDRLFSEEYTAVLAAGSLERLAVVVGHPIQILDRAELESGTPILTALDAGERVALLVPGDPFAATTHLSLRLAAEERGHRWRYLPGASVLSAAAGYLGLQPYRFGRVVSLPFPAPGFAPTSPLEMIAANRRADLHTLVLLDLRPAEGRYLLGPEAIRILRSRDPERQAWPDPAPIAIVARVGRPDAAAFVGAAAELMERDAGGPMHCLIVPAPTLHFEEERALRRWTTVP